MNKKEYITSLAIFIILILTFILCISCGIIGLCTKEFNGYMYFITSLYVFALLFYVYDDIEKFKNENKKNEDKKT